MLKRYKTMATKLKAFPEFRTDEEADHFVETANLSEYDISDMKPTHFNFGPKSEVLETHLPPTLIEALRLKARERGISYGKLVRDALEQTLSQ